MRNILVPVVDGRVDMTSGFRIPGRPNHNGVDFFPVPRGTKLPILSFDDGVVVLIQRGHRTSGNWLEIWQDDGLTLTYKHLDSIDVLHNQRIARGQRIGIMGKSGNATGVHLHLEARRERQNNGGRNAFDPMPMILARMAEIEREARPMRIAISSGHGLHVRGASSLIDEVDEARRVVNRIEEILKTVGGNVSVFHDDTTRIINGNVQQAVRENVNTIVNWHNSLVRDIDVSIHFNGIDGIRDAGIGVETLYKQGNEITRKLASRISKGISDVSGLVLRRGNGTWAQTGLGFLNNTNINQAVLVEVCFVNSRTDVRLYKENFEAICLSITESLLEQNTNSATLVSAPQAASPSPPASGRNFRVLVGAFDTKKEADAVRDRVRLEPGREGAWTVRNGDVWQVQAASGPNLDGAERIADELRAAGIKGVIVV